MRYKELGNTGLQISAITIGTWGIGGAGWGDISRSASVDAIRTAIDHGVNAIDTAPIYGFGNPNLPDFGYGCAEEIIREAIVGQRDRLLLVTKCGLNYNRSIGPKSLYKRMTRAEIMEGCEGSLRRLGTDYLDLLFVHWPDDTTPLEEVAEAMQLLKTQGKIRCYGLSNFTQGDTLRADALLHVGAVQPQYSMVSRSSEAFMQAVHRRGIGTMTYGSLGAGVLTGVYRTLPQFSPNDTRVTFYDYFKKPKFSRIQALLKTMDEIAATHHATPAQVAINWSTQKDFVDTAILGFSKPSHAVQNCAALDWVLSPDEFARLDRAIALHLEGAEKSEETQ